MSNVIPLIDNINGVLAGLEFPPCNGFSLRSLDFTLVQNSDTLKTYELFPEVGAACSFEIPSPIGNVPVNDLEVIIGVNLPLEFESTDFNTDVPFSVSLSSSFGCESFSVKNTNGGDVSALLDLFCDDLDIPQQVIDGFNEFGFDEVIAGLRDLTGGPFIPEDFETLLLNGTAEIEAGNLKVLNEEEVLQVSQSFASQALEIPFVADLLQGDLVALLEAFVDSGFDADVLSPVFDYADGRARDPRAIALFFAASLVDPELAQAIQDIPFVDIAEATIPTALQLLGNADEDLEQVLVRIFGDELTVLELIQSGEATRAIENIKVDDFLPLLIENDRLLAAVDLTIAVIRGEALLSPEVLLQLLVLVNQNLAQEVLGLVAIANANIPELFEIFEIDDVELEQILVGIFGANLTVFEALQSDKVLRSLVAVPLEFLLPVVIDDEILLQIVSPLVVNATVKDLFDTPLLLEILATFQELLFPVDVFLNSTIPEAFFLLDIDFPEVEEVLVALFGANLTISQLIEEELALVIIANIPLEFLFPLFIEDEAVLTVATALFANATVQDLFDPLFFNEVRDSIKLLVEGEVALVLLGLDETLGSLLNDTLPEVFAFFGVEINNAEFEAVFFSIFDPQLSIAELIENVAALGSIPLPLLSNTTFEEFIAELDTGLLFDLFNLTLDGLVNSTIEEAFLILGATETQLEDLLLELFGDNITVAELFEKNETLALLEVLPFSFFLEIFIQDDNVLAFVAPFIGNATLSELLNSTDILEELAFVLKTELLLSLIDFPLFELLNSTIPEAFALLDIINQDLEQFLAFVFGANATVFDILVDDEAVLALFDLPLEEVLPFLTDDLKVLATVSPLLTNLTVGDILTLNVDIESILEEALFNFKEQLIFGVLDFEFINFLLNSTLPDALFLIEAEINAVTEIVIAIFGVDITVGELIEADFGLAILANLTVEDILPLIITDFDILEAVLPLVEGNLTIIEFIETVDFGDLLVEVLFVVVTDVVIDVFFPIDLLLNSTIPEALLFFDANNTVFGEILVAIFGQDFTIGELIENNLAFTILGSLPIDLFLPSFINVAIDKFAPFLANFTVDDLAGVLFSLSDGVAELLDEIIADVAFEIELLVNFTTVADVLELLEFVDEDVEQLLLAVLGANVTVSELLKDDAALLLFTLGQLPVDFVLPFVVKDEDILAKIEPLVDNVTFEELFAQNISQVVDELLTIVNEILIIVDDLIFGDEYGYYGYGNATANATSFAFEGFVQVLEILEEVLNLTIPEALSVHGVDNAELEQVLVALFGANVTVGELVPNEDTILILANLPLDFVLSFFIEDVPVLEDLLLFVGNSTVFDILQGNFPPDLVLLVDGINLGVQEALNETISELFDRFGIENELLEQILIIIFGDDLGLMELVEGGVPADGVTRLPLALVLLPLVGDNEVLLDLVSGFTIADVLNFQLLSLTDLLIGFGTDVETIALLGSFLNIDDNLLDIVIALVTGDFTEVIGFDLLGRIPEAVDALALIYGSDIPSNPVDIVTGLFEFIIVRTQNMVLDFSQPFDVPQVELLQVIALFDPLVAENIEDITAGTITIGEFAELARLPNIVVPVAAGSEVVVSPAVVSVNLIAFIDQASVAGSGALILPSLVIAEGSQISAFLNVDNGVETSQFGVVTDLEFRLDVAATLLADLDGLLDIGLFNIEDVADTVNTGAEVAACAVSNLALGLVAVAPAFDISFDFIFLDTNDVAAFNGLLTGVLGDLYRNFIPNLVNNLLKSLEGTAFSIIDAEAQCLEHSIAAAANDGGNDDDDSNEGNNNAAAIAVPIVIFALLLIIVAAFVLTKRQKIKKTRSEKEKNILEAEQEVKSTL